RYDAFGVRTETRHSAGGGKRRQRDVVSRVRGRGKEVDRRRGGKEGAVTEQARRVVVATSIGIAACVAMLSAQQPPVVRALTEPWPKIEKIDRIEIVPVLKNVYMLAG